MSDQWDRALIRGALREVGYDAVGARDVNEARRYRAIEPGRGAIGLIVTDHDAATSRDALTDVIARHRNPPVILVARTTQNPPPGPWARVIRRPVSVADVIAFVETALPLPAERRRPLDTEGE